MEPLPEVRVGGRTGGFLAAKRDPTTRRLLEDILTAEEEHADDLTSLMFVDVNAPSARNGNGPGGKDNGP